MEIEIGKLSKQQVDELATGLSLDLVAYFKLLEQEVIKKLHEHKDLSPQEIIHKLGEII